MVRPHIDTELIWRMSSLFAYKILYDGYHLINDSNSIPHPFGKWDTSQILSDVVDL